MAGSIFIYFLSALFLIWIFAFIAYFIKKKRLKKLLTQIREDWGRRKTESSNFNLIENFSLLTTTIPFHKLTPQTINDVDIHEVFSFIDRTNSKPGQQYLFNKLITPTNSITALEKYNEQVNFFTENIPAREDAQLQLAALNHHDAYYITNLLQDKLLEKPKWAYLFIVDTFIVIAMLVLSVKFHVLLIWLMLPFSLNLFFHYWNKKNTGKFTKSFPQLNSLINVSKLFIKKDLPFEKTSVQKSINNLKRFQRKFKLLDFGETDNNDIAQILLLVLDLIKAFFLIEIHTFFSTLKELKNKREDVNNLINYIGSIDAALSTASLRSGISKYSTPTFINKKKELTAQNLYHPLIADCVPNSIAIKDKSILITGSNMSGKSTFIRAIAINSILAQTIYTCFADEFITPVVKVFSSVRITDNLLDAKSYYFEEVNVIGSLIKESEKHCQNIFILDEVFKGTNTIERVAAAKAILSYLNKNENIVLVSTHDIELAELLKNEFDLYHFVEDIANDNLVFDHQLKAGTLKSRNAIKILALSNYPAQIIDEAKSIANKN
jgi:DNA mismatch repair ATPase MutS